MPKIFRVALSAALSLLVLTACDPAKKPAKAEPNPGAQAAAPAADPGPHNNAEVVTVRVAWLGERSGTVEVSINHVVQPQVSAGKPTKSSGFYTGLYEITIPILGVSNVGLAWFPDAPRMHAQCEILHQGIPVDAHGVQTGPCAVSWQVTR
jgi:hypothetical protein